jgi:hypothetical protein
MAISEDLLLTFESKIHKMIGTLTILFEDWNQTSMRQQFRSFSAQSIEQFRRTLIKSANTIAINWVFVGNARGKIGPGLSFDINTLINVQDLQTTYELIFNSPAPGTDDLLDEYHRAESQASPLRYRPQQKRKPALERVYEALQINQNNLHLSLPPNLIKQYFNVELFGTEHNTTIDFCAPFAELSIGNTNNENGKCLGSFFTWTPLTRTRPTRSRSGSPQEWEPVMNVLKELDHDFNEEIFYNESNVYLANPPFNAEIIDLLADRIEEIMNDFTTIIVVIPIWDAATKESLKNTDDRSNKEQSQSGLLAQKSNSLDDQQLRSEHSLNSSGLAQRSNSLDDYKTNPLDVHTAKESKKRSPRVPYSGYEKLRRSKWFVEEAISNCFTHRFYSYAQQTYISASSCHVLLMRQGPGSITLDKFLEDWANEGPERKYLHAIDSKKIEHPVEYQCLNFYNGLILAAKILQREGYDVKMCLQSNGPEAQLKKIKGRVKHVTTGVGNIGVSSKPILNRGIIRGMKSLVPEITKDQLYQLITKYLPDG